MENFPVPKFRQVAQRSSPYFCEKLLQIFFKKVLQFPELYGILLSESEVREMTKMTMIRKYRNLSAADGYILGFILNGCVYMVEVAEIMPRYLNVEEASRNQGENLRLRLKKAHKTQLMKKAPIMLGYAEELVADKYNKGEVFEKMVTEYFGQTWKKDTVPFWEAGDIRVDGRELQIKLDTATLVNTKTLHKIQK